MHPYEQSFFSSNLRRLLGHRCNLVGIPLLLLLQGVERRIAARPIRRNEARAFIVMRPACRVAADNRSFVPTG